MRISIALFLIIFYCLPAFSEDKTDSLLNKLKYELTREKDYDNVKEAGIKKLKALLAQTPDSNLQARFDYCSKLYDEYKVYQFDEAYVYAVKLQEISRLMHNRSKEYYSKIKLGFILLSSGMFKETFDCLNGINLQAVNDDIKIEYYSIKSRANSDLANFNNDRYYGPHDNEVAIKYLDSAIALCKPNSYDLILQQAYRYIRTAHPAAAALNYRKLLDHYDLSLHQRAIINNALSDIYFKPEQRTERMNLLTQSAIYDIKSSTKETVALFTLGELLYKNGNVQDAYVFIQRAMADAEYYGARQRKVKISAVLPLVAAERVSYIEGEKNKFLTYFLLITGFSVLIVLFLCLIFIQLKKVKVTDRIIKEKNIQLELINEKLIENSKIKEEYIGYFFNVISGFILKLEKLKRTVDRKLAAKKYDDIQITVNEINIKKERETLFYTFDHVFLKIFPNFITEFNLLFKKEDQIWPKDHEVLNTDLRIFALIRMGVHDNETIANILEYSVNTIYVYKTRIKAKAIFNGDEFEHKVMAIKAVDTLDDLSTGVKNYSFN
jgi:hypothetical protein